MNDEQVALIAAAMMHSNRPRSTQHDVFKTASEFIDWLERNL